MATDLLAGLLDPGLIWLMSASHALAAIAGIFPCKLVATTTHVPMMSTLMVCEMAGQYALLFSYPAW